MAEFPFLSVLVFAPLLGAITLMLPMFLPAGHKWEHLVTDDHARRFSFSLTLLVFVLSLIILLGYDGSTAQMQFVESYEWIPRFGVGYLVGIDGISVFLVLLTTFLMPLVVLASGSVKKSVRGYLISMLALESAMLGTLVALDTFLFYVFWEFMLAPMYFIIGIWGGKRRIYATVKFVLYTVVGSVLMFAALLYVVWQYYLQTGELCFAISNLVNVHLTFQEELWLFAAFALAFGIKVPIFPFHTWLPDAHVEAPTGGSVVLAGVLLKMGIYGFFRFAYPLFPRGAEAFGPLLALLAVIGIVYGALVAWAQTDIKKLVAYSSVSHLGYCVLGLVAFNVMSSTGSIYQMLSHGITTGALFLMVGVLYDRKHTRMISDYGGLASKVPMFAFFFLVFTLGSIALPLTTGFVGEFLILLGSFQVFPVYTSIALLGVILGAVYMLTLYLKTMFGEIDESKNGDLTDLTKIECATLMPLFLLVFLMGIYPQPILSRMEPTVKAHIESVQARKERLALNLPGKKEKKYV